MGYFPMHIDLSNKTIMLVGDGVQIREKEEKLKSFGGRLVFVNQVSEKELNLKPAMVIVGDLEKSEAERISLLCQEKQIPVNVVDVPELCTFFFPAIISRGELTISVSTGGQCPAVCSFVRGHVEANLPDRTEVILKWAGDNRIWLRQQGILKEAVYKAFDLERPLTEEECKELICI